MTSRRLTTIAAILWLGSAGTAAARTCVTPPRGLVAWWRGEGDGADAAGNNDGVLYGVQFEPGKVGQAIRFDGRDDSVVAPSSPSLNITGNALTVSLWTKAGSQNPHAYLVSKTDRDQTVGYGMSTGSGASLQFFVGKRETPDFDFAWDDDWHLLTGVYDGANVAIYVDAVRRAFAAATGSIEDASANALYLADVYGGDHSFGGLLDEVQIYDRDLTPAEISSIYRSGNVGLCPMRARGGRRPPPGPCEHSCGARVSACRREHCAGARGAARRQCAEDCRGRTGCGAHIGTVADVVSRCRTDRNGLTGFQELRIRRRGCDPVTVLRFEATLPLADPFGLCRRGSINRSGHFSPLVGVFQRLGVSRDGSAVVFEVTNEFQLTGRYPLRPDEQGFFSVRSDGSGLRRLGPASRIPPWSLGPGPNGVLTATWVYTTIAFSPSGRSIAYEDIGVDLSGAYDRQVFTLDLKTGARAQATRWTHTRETPEILWFDERTLFFLEFSTSPWKVRLDDPDGMPSPLAHLPVSGGGASVPFHFGITGRNFFVVSQGVDGPSVNSDQVPFFDRVELFRFDRDRVLQLTNFGRGDTEELQQLAAGGKRVMFKASADPVGENRNHDCQLFSVSTLGGGIRQLTHLGTGVPSQKGCEIGEKPGCALLRIPLEVPSSPTAVFYSDCDPFGTNPTGTEIFAFAVDRGRLSQLTDTAGVIESTPDVVEVELPGPVAQSAP